LDIYDFGGLVAILPNFERIGFADIEAKLGRECDASQLKVSALSYLIGFKLPSEKKNIKAAPVTLCEAIWMYLSHEPNSELS
jgi:hypothetical protein